MNKDLTPIELKRIAESRGFEGACEVQKCVLDVRFGDTVHLGSPV